jgi:hypothetical protein
MIPAGDRPAGVPHPMASDVHVAGRRFPQAFLQST